MSHVGIKKSYVGVIKQEPTSNTPPPNENTSVQVGGGGVFTNINAKNRKLFERNAQGNYVYSAPQRAVGVLGRGVGYGLGAWNAARTLSESQGGDMVSDLGRAGVAGQQTYTLANAATNPIMDMAAGPSNSTRVGVDAGLKNLSPSQEEKDGEITRVLTGGSTTTGFADKMKDGFGRLKESYNVGVEAKQNAKNAEQNAANQQYIQDQANRQIQAERQKQAIDAEAEKIRNANALSDGRFDTQ
tara:strand:- start:1098 stop:1826 length:729 start_codon:yes stop_codon:yes gene_type:complete